MSNRKELISRLEKQANIIRQDVLTMIHAAKSGHPGGSLSAADIVTALYFHFMHIDPQNPSWPQRDRFILSKGHACPVWYSCLAERGYFPVEELKTLREIDSRLQGHPDMTKTPGIDITTGSLGQGLSAGVGMALGLKKSHIDALVYVMLGDGELNEGQVWEAALSASKFRLDNLITIVDYNDLQLDGYCHDVMPLEPLSKKWQSFNWNVLDIDGNKMIEVVDAIENAVSIKNGKPTIILAHTVKGKGVSYMENQCDWHGKAPDDEQFVKAMAELGTSIEITKIAQRPNISISTTTESLQKTTQFSDRLLKPVPTRDAYGEVLVEMGAAIDHLVVLEADISKSTRTFFFAQKYPDRFFQFGVAEANMMVAAAGLATAGYLPFVSTYAVFASMRACEQIRTFVAYPHLNVKIGVCHGGITPANDGVTHQATEDLGIMRTIPNMTVIMPADYYATKALVRSAADYDGPVYLRFTRDAVPIIYAPEDTFTIGKGKIVQNGDDISLLTIGDMLSITIEAAKELARGGISAEVIDFHTIKPIDKELILTTASKTGCVMTIEDHQIQCGLGSAVAEVLCEEKPTLLRRIGLRDTFAESGRYDQLLTKYGMDVKSIVSTAKQLISTVRR